MNIFLELIPIEEEIASSGKISPMAAVIAAAAIALLVFGIIVGRIDKK